jgi:DNA-binding response OmpR family regulator
MKPVSGFRLMVLKYLKAQGREVPRAELIAHLWGSNPPKGADRRIAALMVNIRKAGYLPVTSTSYRFDGEILVRGALKAAAIRKPIRRHNPRRYVRLPPSEPRRTLVKSVLNCLLVNQGRIVSVDELVEYVWGDDEDGGPVGAREMIRMYAVMLRRMGWEIDNIHGRGYAIWWRGQERPIRIRDEPMNRKPDNFRFVKNRMAA